MKTFEEWLASTKMGFDESEIRFFKFIWNAATEAAAENAKMYAVYRKDYEEANEVVDIAYPWDLERQGELSHIEIHKQSILNAKVK